MVSKSNIDRETKEYFQKLKEQVNELVEARCQESKQLGLEIDRIAIENECTEQLFKDLNQAIATATDRISQFYNLLKVDHANLHKDLMQILEKEAKRLKITTGPDASVNLGATLQIPPEFLQKIYKAAVALKIKGENEKSSLYFGWLSTVDPHNAGIWPIMGLIESGYEQRPTDLSADEKAIYEDIKGMIDEKVFAEVERSLKQGAKSVDDATIRKQCTDQVFQELMKTISSSVTGADAFPKLLQADDPGLYKELMQQRKNEMQDVKPLNTLQEMLTENDKRGFSVELIDKVYQKGYSLFSAGSLEKALVYFTWLCAEDSQNPQLWFLKGLTEQKLAKYNDAIVSYYQVLLVEPTYIHVYPQAIGCLLLMGEKDAAKKLYEVSKTDLNADVCSQDKTFVENMEKLKKILV